MAEQLQAAGFQIEAGRAVSHFRQPALKRLVPAQTLAAMDGSIQQLSAAWKLAPSVFLRTTQSRGRARCKPEARSAALAARAWNLRPPALR